MRKVHVTSSGAYLEPSAEYGKIVKASEKAAEKVEYLINNRLCDFLSFKILCSNYRSMKNAAEKVFKKSVSGGKDESGARKEYQRALRVIGDTFGERLAYYGGEVVRARGEAAREIEKDMKNGVYAGKLPKSDHVSEMIGDMEGVRGELDMVGISSRVVSKSVDSSVKKAEKIRQQLERYKSKF